MARAQFARFLEPLAHVADNVLKRLCLPSGQRIRWVRNDRRVCRDAVHWCVAWIVLLLDGMGRVAGNRHLADFALTPAGPVRRLADVDWQSFRS